MDAIYIGIDVSKNRLDVVVGPSGESFAVERNGAGIHELIGRLQAISPHLVAVEATGGFESIVAAGLAGATLPVADAADLNRSARSSLRQEADSGISIRSAILTRSHCIYSARYQERIIWVC